MENFEKLLEEYISDEAIEEAVKEKNIEELTQKKVSSPTRNNLRIYDSFIISIEEFLRVYLEMDTTNIPTANLTHAGLKDLTKDNPFVIGISNDIVDVDEVVKREFLIVEDCKHNYGSYLNPINLKNFEELDAAMENLKKIKKTRVLSLGYVTKMYNDFKKASQEYDILNMQCSNYYAVLKKAHKTKVLKNIRKKGDKK